MRLYDDRFLPTLPECVGKLFLALAFEFIVLYGILTALDVFNVPRDFLLLYAGMLFAAFCLLRVIVKIILLRRINRGAPLTRILLAGDTDRVRVVKEVLCAQKSWGHKLVGWFSCGEAEPVEGLDYLGAYEQLNTFLQHEALDEVILALPGDIPTAIRADVDLCRQLGVTVRIVPGMFDPEEKVRSLTAEHVRSVPMLTIRGSRITAAGLFFKRALDVVGASVGFVLFLCLFPLVALAVKLDSPGPVLFRQRRVGLNNRHFSIYKFRSMYVDAEARKQALGECNEMSGHMFKMKNDPRITRVGRILRRTSLDEVPQFLNVLKGEMSLVGTRPPTVEEVEHYAPWQRRRVSMKPGMTGLWQISGRSDVETFQDVVKYDLTYIDEWSLGRDIVILLKTVVVVITGKGAV